MDATVEKSPLFFPGCGDVTWAYVAGRSAWNGGSNSNNTLFPKLSVLNEEKGVTLLLVLNKAATGLTHQSQI